MATFSNCYYSSPKEYIVGSKKIAEELKTEVLEWLSQQTDLGCFDDKFWVDKKQNVGGT